ncbi:MAG: hypothetical protein M3P43_08440 [Actinomycetota bacterium]|nr:hypothetical protein [Actinomycetota bacterium]
MNLKDAPAGRRLWAGLELLDHQIVDPDGHMAGKVDDLELQISDEPGALPVVTAILSGLGALADQIGGEAGKWMMSIEQRITHPDAPGTATIAFGVIKRIGEHVEVAVNREQLDSYRAERWVRDVIIDKIPGAGDAAE